MSTQKVLQQSVHEPPPFKWSHLWEQPKVSRPQLSLIWCISSYSSDQLSQWKIVHSPYLQP